MMRKKHIIFDFDGTLADTNDIIIASWQATFRHFTGGEADVGEITATFGETLYDTMERFFPGRRDEGVRVYREYQNEQGMRVVKPFDGIMDLLFGLRAGGHTTSIVTARTTQTTREYLKALDMEQMFDVIVAHEDTDAHKPSPEPLYVALGKLAAACGVTAIDRDEVILLGDTKYDMGCGANAGVDTVLVGWSIGHDLEEMKSLGWEPTYRISRPEDLQELL